jgi:hypothetical protein
VEWNSGNGEYIRIYTVFHDFRAELQEVISYVCVIKKVHMNICPILDGYGVMATFSFPYTPSCEPRLSSERPRYFDT